MPGPEPKRKRATRTRTFDRGDESQDATQKLKSFSEDSAVQDRILSWRVQNVEEAVDLDDLSVRSRPRSEVLRTPISSRAASPITKEPQTTPRRRSTKWVQQDNKQWVKQRRSMRHSQGQTDLHYVNQVEAEVEQNEMRSDDLQHHMPPTEYIPDDGTHARNVTKSRAEREERRRRRREARARISGDNNTRNHQDSQSTYFPTHDDDHRTEGRSCDRPTTDSIEPEISDAQRWTAVDGTLQPDDGCSETQENEYTHSHAYTYQPSKYAQMLGQGKGALESIQPLKSRKLTILNKTREILGGRTDTPPTPSNRIPSIEAWLEEQPGPSFERDDQTPRPSHDVKPSKRHSRKKRVAIEPTIVEIEDPNKIWDSIAATEDQVPGKQRNAKKQQLNISAIESETSPSKRRLFSFEVPEGSSKGAESTPPPQYIEHQIEESNLQRRGAKSRRAKSYSISEGAASPIVPVERPPLSQVDIGRPAHHTPPSESRPNQAFSLTEVVDIAKGEVDTPAKIDQVRTVALKRKLTHEDLLSILSQPQPRKSTRSVRSIRRAQNESPRSVLPALLEAMRNEEPKYNQELRTLVDGVTPVLLQSLLSKADAEITLGLFSNNENQDANFTKHIIQMGIALERLKALHSRIPLGEHEVDALLSWATTTQKYYQDYIKWWRLGFHGILVSLAPLGTPRTAEEELMAQDLDGDLTDAHGQKADVAYLQKRPLVRLKKISKLISAIRDEQPTNEKALRLADTYAELTEKAKQRYNEEQGRLEDEAAANIDISRARDLKTMAPITSAQVDKRRKVRARDCFEMTLYHSTGQRVDCRIEIIIRDDPQPQGVGGDILICQVEEKSKWLLFAPINIGNVSARRDESSLDVVLMIRGIAGINENWHELLALKADIPDAVVEWVQMLGSSPLPPKICQNLCVVQPQKVEQSHTEDPRAAISPTVSSVPLSKAALASLPSDVDVPIGEPSVLSRSRNKQDKPKPASTKVKTSMTGGPKLNLGGGLQKKEVTELSLRMKAAISQEMHLSLPNDAPPSSTESSRSKEPPSRNRETPRHPDPPPSDNNDKKRVEPLLPRKLPERSCQPNNVKISPQASKVSWSITSNVTSQFSSSVHPDTSSWRLNTGSTEVPLVPDSGKRQQSDRIHDPFLSDKRTTSMSSWSVNRSETREEASTPQTQPPAKSKASTSLTETIRERWTAVSGCTVKTKGVTTELKRTPMSTELATDNYPVLQLRSPKNLHQEQNKSPEEEPPPPPHRENPPPSTNLRATVSHPTAPDQFENKTDSQWMSGMQREFQSSSGASASDSEEDEDGTSDTSEEDYGSELKDQATPLVTVAQVNRRLSQIPSQALPSLPSSGPRTLQPSDSASNVPYRRAPSPSAYPASKKWRSIAMICSWSDRGVWQPIQDEECSIVISPGLVQAFKMTAAHSQPMAGAEWEDGPQLLVENQSPLVEFELTPIVPLRKGTALDITIRSPPTAKSTIRTTNNVMFRSKTPQDCDKLYQLINWARCNNPTYAQLARSRAREESLTFNPNATSTKTRSWFSFGSHQRSSYRASSQPPPSMADTGTSSNSSFSAFSALRRFGKNSPFSLKRSSVVRRSGVSVTGESLYSSSNGTGSGSGTSTPAPSQAGFVPGPDGPNVPETSAEAVNGGGMVNNMKIHLFLRQGQKWEQLGQCHLTVLPAITNSQSRSSAMPSDSTALGQTQSSQSTTTAGPSAMSNARTRHYRLPSSSHTPHKIHGDGREKRILITSVKNKEAVLLDETLGESCFEKIMQTGIAINVWKEDEAVQDRGGVLTGRGRTYMAQFKTSMEASWVFNMCGVYRYGHTTSGN